MQGQRKVFVVRSWVDPALVLLQERGLEHERRYVEQSARAGAAGPSTSPADSNEAAIARAADAMHAGVALIVQPALRNGRWFGRPDLLRRVETGRIQSPRFGTLNIHASGSATTARSADITNAFRYPPMAAWRWISSLSAARLLASRKQAHRRAWRSSARRPARRPRRWTGIVLRGRSHQHQDAQRNEQAAAEVAQRLKTAEPCTTSGAGKVENASTVDRRNRSAANLPRLAKESRAA